MGCFLLMLACAGSIWLRYCDLVIIVFLIHKLLVHRSVKSVCSAAALATATSGLCWKLGFPQNWDIERYMSSWLFWQTIVCAPPAVILGITWAKSRTIRELPMTRNLKVKLLELLSGCAAVTWLSTAAVVAFVRF